MKTYSFPTLKLEGSGRWLATCESSDKCRYHVWFQGEAMTVENGAVFKNSKADYGHHGYFHTRKLHEAKGEGKVVVEHLRTEIHALRDAAIATYKAEQAAKKAEHERLIAESKARDAALELLAACEASMRGEPGWQKLIHAAVAKAKGA